MRTHIRINSDLIGHDYIGDLHQLGFGARKPDGRFAKELLVLRTDDGRVIVDPLNENADITITNLSPQSRFGRWLRKLRGG